MLNGWVLQSSSLLPLHSRANLRLARGNLCTPSLPLGRPTPHRNCPLETIPRPVRHDWLRRKESTKLRTTRLSSQMFESFIGLSRCKRLPAPLFRQQLLKGFTQKEWILGIWATLNLFLFFCGPLRRKDWMLRLDKHLRASSLHLLSHLSLAHFESSSYCKGLFMKYAILGDDIVIVDRRVAELYEEVMEELQMTI
ncbi:hypothetical protein VNO80_23064 [Phaseolus coccineus]|uniref:Uncharacterized protein n=1 Tax=Phaseolus coccineus TaxID=3886 RepID=A0AAN9M6Z7_PHACN